MNTKSIKYVLAAGLVCCGISTTMISCGNVLDEQPRSTYDPSFFNTPTGIEGGLTALYAHLRYFYGNGYYLNTLETGTDEYTYAQSADGNFKDADLSGAGSVTSNSTVAGGAWNELFSNINTCNGIIENGTAANLSDALLAEAYFFRAFDYFILVQTYGGVPLDLGNGKLKFNTTTNRTSVRNTVPEVYEVIFADLEKAIADLPENPRLTGTATKNVARLYLSKAYLTYAWWLENPNNIPTYPECTRDASQAQSYYQKAFDMAKTAIDNPGPYGLMPTALLRTLLIGWKLGIILRLPLLVHLATEKLTQFSVKQFRDSDVLGLVWLLLLMHSLRGVYGRMMSRQLTPVMMQLSPCAITQTQLNQVQMLVRGYMVPMA